MAAPEAIDKKIVHYDTDIGSDVDDALALAYLAKSPEVTLSGVTTVFGPVDQRSNVAKTLLDRLNLSHVVVSSGESQPISPKAEVWSTGQENYLTKKYDLSKKENKNILPAGKKYTLLATGPLTNLAIMIKEGLISENGIKCVILGGSITPNERVPLLENNFAGDPAAAAQVLHSNIPITLIPVDLTLKYPMSNEQEERIISSSSDSINLIGEWLRVWKEWTKKNIPSDSPFHGIIYFHDPLAAAYITHPHLFKTKTMMLSVNNDGSVLVGKGRTVEVCTDIDERVIPMIMDRLTI